VELWRESAYDSNDRSTYRSVCTMATIGKNRKASCSGDVGMVHYEPLFLGELVDPSPNIGGMSIDSSDDDHFPSSSAERTQSQSEL